ncbi:MAG: type II toxin-antitoxin system RelE/ParE family toxin [Lachnospiraceae bacterium]|nr:type II toxin-antitoxin system RelE/ParE family toxin [Lachnospiraceae bacterium]
MKKIKYTPDAADKLRALKLAIAREYGVDKAKKIIKSITDAVKGLYDYEEKGPEVSKMFDLVSDYRYIFISRNYVFYRIEDKYIRIINFYHEKEDFMWQLFGIDTTPQDAIDYWDE